MTPKPNQTFLPNESDYLLTSGFRKYPPKRDIEDKCPCNWIEGKKESDGVWPYWRVHDKLYDLSSFMSKHPGGKFWLEKTQGCDITEYFESSHVSEIPRSYLEKYYVKDAEGPRNSPFTFNDKDFFMALKRRADPILKKAGTGPTWEATFIHDGILAAYLFFFLVGGWYQSLVMIILAGFTIMAACFASHNFSHQKDNWRMYTFDLSFMSLEDWKVMHVLSHHAFPNTIYDFEIEAFEPYLSYLPIASRFSNCIASFVMFFGTSFVMHIKNCIKLARADTTKWTDMTLVLKAVQFLYLFVVATSVQSGLLHIFVYQWSVSFYYMTVSLTVSHHHPAIFREGDKLPTNKDWGLLQIFATRDRNFVMKSQFLSAIAFGNHTLHHLFPTVDHSKLPLVLDPFMETCKEFGVEFKLFTLWEAIQGMWRALLNTKPNENLPDVLNSNFKDG